MLTSDLLAELATIRGEAWTPTIDQHTQGIVPPWCELVVEIKRDDDWPLNFRAPLRRHDGEFLIAKIHEALHPDGTSTMVGTLWFELDAVVDKIQRRVIKKKPPKPEHVGQARGLALAIAIMKCPGAYDVDVVREEAMERWLRRNP